MSYIYDNGNVGIGIEPSYKLDISGDINFSGNLRKNGSTYVPDLALKANDANYAVFKIKSPSQNTAASLDLATPFNSSSVSKVSIVAQGISSFSRADLYFCLNNTADNTTPVSTVDSKMVIKSGGNVGINVINPAYKLDVNGDINYTGDLRKNGNIVSGSSQWVTNGTSISYSAGDVYINKRLCVSDGNAVAIPSNYMANGSLTIGSTIANFGGFESSWDYWTNNTAGMIMECLDRTSIAIHDAGSRVVGFMHYNGFNEIIIGYNLGWGYPSAVIIGGGLLKIGVAWRILE